MSYPFPEIERNRLYAKTFLRDVTITLWFHSRVDCMDANCRFAAFCQEIFGLKDSDFSELKRYGEEGAPRIVSSDGLVAFVFGIDALLLKIKYPLYKKFDDIQNFISIARKYLSILEVKDLTQLRISKFNEINYNYQSDVISIDQVMRGLFSNNLMEWDGFKHPDFTGVARWERKVVLNDDANNTNTTITYGFAKDESDSRKGSLTLKIGVDAYDINDTKELDNMLEDCNHIVDRTFRWSASDSILKEMEKNE